jgi:hypothetical protein
MSYSSRNQPSPNLRRRQTDPQQAMQNRQRTQTGVDPMMNRMSGFNRTAFMAATDPATPTPAAAPAAFSPQAQVTSAITPYQPAPLDASLGMLAAGSAAPAPTAAGASQPVQDDQSFMWQNLLSGPLSSAGVGMEEQAAKMDAQLGLNRATAGANSGIGLMNSGLGFLGNQLMAQQPMQQFKSRMATMPINMLSGLFGRRT